jgi:hypothetical protein
MTENDIVSVSHLQLGYLFGGEFNTSSCSGKIGLPFSLICSAAKKSQPEGRPTMQKVIILAE